MTHPAADLLNAIKEGQSFEFIQEAYNQAIEANETFPDCFPHPIPYVAEKKCFDAIVFIVEKLGGGVDKIGYENKSALDFAIDEYDYSAVKKLLKLGATSKIISFSQFYRIVTSARCEFLEFLLYHQMIDLNHVRKIFEHLWDTPLDANILHILFAWNCDVNVRNYHKETVTMSYFILNHCHIKDFSDKEIENIKIFLAAGADLSLTYPNGKTILEKLNQFVKGKPVIYRKIKILTDGITPEFQEEFDQKCREIRQRTDKRCISLFVLMLPTLELT